MSSIGRSGGPPQGVLQRLGDAAAEVSSNVGERVLDSPVADVIPGLSERAEARRDSFKEVDPNDPRLQNTICPFMSTALKEGLITVDDKGRARVDQLEDVLGPLGNVTEFFAKQNHAVNRHGERIESSADDGLLDFARINPLRTHFDPINLAGSKGDHIGDSGILSVERGFDAGRFEAFVSHSSDGKTMSQADFGKALTALQGLDPEVDTTGERLLNKAKSAGEWALMVGLLGKKDADGDLKVDIQEMRALFEDNKFPADWVDRVKQNNKHFPFTKWGARTAAINHAALHAKPTAELGSTGDMAAEAFRHMGPSGASLEGTSQALGVEPSSSELVNTLEGARQGVCPVGGDASSVSSNINEIQTLHDQLPTE